MTLSDSMYLLYADESGSSGDSSHQFFVLAGVCVFERQVHWISEKLEQIAARFDPAQPGDVELHGSPMLSGKGRWRRVPAADRLLAFRDALGVLAASHRDNRVFVIVVKKAAASPADPVEYAFEQLANRFDRYLMRLHNAGNTQRGIVIFDKSTYETTLQGLATDFRTVGHRWGVLRNFAEVPLFLNSKASRLIQLADLVAHAFRAYERNDAQYFNLIRGRIDIEGGVQHGLHVRA